MRKRIIIAAIVLAMGSAMAGLPAAAAKSQTYGDLTYINYGGWVEILDCAQDVVTVEIPEKIDGVKVRDIGDNAFSNCKSLTAITIPDGLEHIGEYAFSSCTSLTSITLPDSVKTIGGGAFGYCSALEELELPAKLETLGKNACYQCTGLTEMTIPQSVTSIGDRAFWECGNLTEITVEEGNTAYSSENGILFDLARTEILCYPAAKADASYSIPQSVNTIGTAAFYGCLHLEEIIIPETVTTIEEYGFYYCRGLQQIELPETIETIEIAAFYGCTQMTAIYVPVSVTEVRTTAFGQCISLTDVYYGGSETDWAAMTVDDTMDMNAYFTGADIHYRTTEIEAEIVALLGDVNNDGEFTVADVVLLQKWLLAVPDTHLANWKAADFCEDDRLDVFDLCLMKRALIEKMNDISQNVDTSFKLQGVADIRTNGDNHTKWTGYIARSESDLLDIIQENEGVSAAEISLEDIDDNAFNDKSLVIIYSIGTAGNSYSIIDDISIKGTDIDVSTVSKKPEIATPDMLYRRYIYIIDKNAVTNVRGFTFNDTSSFYQNDEKSDVVNWFKDWCYS